MTIKEKFEYLYAGLNQIPTRNLKDLREQLKDRKSKIIFSGAITSPMGY